jgi:hypothetical protein
LVNWLRGGFRPLSSNSFFPAFFGYCLLDFSDGLGIWLPAWMPRSGEVRARILKSKTGCNESISLHIAGVKRGLADE